MLFVQAEVMTLELTHLGILHGYTLAFIQKTMKKNTMAVPLHQNQWKIQWPCHSTCCLLSTVAQVRGKQCTENSVHETNCNHLIVR
jgi:hypothetical protein